MTADDRLGQEVDWFGMRGVITGIWSVPTFSVQFPDGHELVIGQDRVTLLGHDSGAS